MDELTNRVHQYEKEEDYESAVNLLILSFGLKRANYNDERSHEILEGYLYNDYVKEEIKEKIRKWYDDKAKFEELRLEIAEQEEYEQKLQYEKRKTEFINKIEENYRLSEKAWNGKVRRSHDDVYFAIYYLQQNTMDNEYGYIHNESYMKLANMYYDGIGFNKNYTEAKNLLKMIKGDKEEKAINMKGVCVYKENRKCYKHMKEAIKLFKQSYKMGYGTAYDNLVCMYKIIIRKYENENTTYNLDELWLVREACTNIYLRYGKSVNRWMIANELFSLSHYVYIKIMEKIEPYMNIINDKTSRYITNKIIKYFY